MAQLFNLLRQLADTPGSTALRESAWVYPIIESVHVLALCLFLGFAALLDLRLLGWALRGTPVSEIGKRVLPWTMVGFVLMIGSGIALFYADPLRFAQNPFFQAKSVLLVVAGFNAWLFHATVWRKRSEWDLATVTPHAARVAGGVSLVAWALIVTAGRMIAYEWFHWTR